MIGLFIQSVKFLIFAVVVLSLAQIPIGSQKISEHFNQHFDGILASEPAKAVQKPFVESVETIQENTQKIKDTISAKFSGIDSGLRGSESHPPPRDKELQKEVEKLSKEDQKRLWKLFQRLESE
jgi:hypothetical protein